MSAFDFFPQEIWLNILEQIITIPINFVNPKHKHIRLITDKWQQGTFKMTYPFLRMVSLDFNQIMDDLKTKYFSNNTYKPLKGYDMCIAMAAEGHLSALKYLHENGAKWTEDTSSYSALHGHLNCLIYAHENGCKWSSETCALAALNGHVDCLKFAHDNGCTWDTECCNNAARRGDLTMIQYLVANGCRWSAQTTEAATIHGHLELLKYLYEHGCPSNPNTNVQLACYGGKIEILKYVHQQGCQLTPNLYESVVASNSMECLLYLRENGVAWPDVDGLRLGVQNKSHECLKYAIDNGCLHDTRTIQLAFEFGNIEVLRQLDQRDPTFNYNVLIPDLVSSAVQGGSLECLKFLIEDKRVPVRNKAGLILAAKFRGKMDAVDYLNQLDPQFEAPGQNAPGGFPWLPY